MILRLPALRKITLATVFVTALAGNEARADVSICSSDGTYYVHWALRASLPAPYKAYNIAACSSGVVYTLDQSSQIWVSRDYAASWTKVGPAPAAFNQLGCSGLWDGYDPLNVYDYDGLTGALWAALNTPGAPLSWSKVANLSPDSVFGAGPSMFVVATPYGQRAQTGTIPFNYGPSDPVPTGWRDSGSIPNSGYGVTAMSPVLAIQYGYSTNVDYQTFAPRIFVADFFANRVSFADGQWDTYVRFTGQYENWRTLPKPASVEPIGIAAESPTVAYVLQFGGRQQQVPIWRAYINSQNCTPNSTW
jgi:hypothetical protein